MTYDYRRAAKKHPDIVTLNRKLIGLKPKFQAFASHMFSGPWSVRAWEDDTDVTLHLEPEGSHRQSWRVEITITVLNYYGRRTPGTYSVRTTLYDKTGRGRAFHREESVTLDGINPGALLGPLRQEALAAMQGSTEKEMAELLEMAESSREALVAARYAIDQMNAALKGAKSPLDVEAALTQAGKDLERAGNELERTGMRVVEVVKQVRASS